MHFMPVISVIRNALQSKVEEHYGLYGEQFAFSMWDQRCACDAQQEKVIKACV